MLLCGAPSLGLGRLSANNALPMQHHSPWPTCRRPLALHTMRELPNYQCLTMLYPPRVMAWSSVKASAFAAHWCSCLPACVMRQRSG